MSPTPVTTRKEDTMTDYDNMGAYARMAKKDLLALIESLTIDNAIARNDDTTDTTPKATPKAPVNHAKPRIVNAAKACPRGIRVNGERVTGRTFAVWYVDGNPKNRDAKRASVDGGSFLAITREGLTAEDATALAEAWVAVSPRTRKGAKVTTYKDAFVVAKAGA